MISTIIFDLSEVLLSGMYRVEQKIAKIVGEPVPLDYLYVQPETEDLHHGKISEDEFWQKMLEKNSWNITIPALKELVRSQMIEIEGTREIIEKLQKNNYKLGLLSVHTKEWIEYCETRHNYHQYFHTIMYSYEVGVSKPDPKAFELILESLQVKPEETLFIDDSRRNIQAANKLGIHTILFKNARQLKKELEQHDIKI